MEDRLKTNTSRWIDTTAAALFILFCGIYTFTARGYLVAADEITNFLAVRQFVETGDPSISCNLREDLTIQRKDGKCFSKFDPGIQILGTPFYIAGRLVGGPAPLDTNSLSIPRVAISLLNVVLTAGTIAVLYLIARSLSDSAAVALEIALIFGLTTIAWPYASTYFAQPIIAFLLVSGMYFLFVEENTSVLRVILCGIGFMLATLTRLDALPLIVVMIGFYHVFNPKRSLRDLAILTTFIGLGLLGQMAYNIYRTGSPLLSGYASEGWNSVFWKGLYGLTISPNKGILFFSPLVAASMPGFILLWKDGKKKEVGLILSLFVIQLATYSSWWTWEGGWSWGPRFLVVTNPFLMLGLIPWLRRRKAMVTIGILAMSGFCVQIVGVTTNILSYLPPKGPLYTRFLYDPQYSQIWLALNGLLQRKVSTLVTGHGLGILTQEQYYLWVFGSLSLIVIGLLWLKKIQSDQPRLSEDPEKSSRSSFVQ
jgi:hypothetical protein